MSKRPRHDFLFLVDENPDMTVSTDTHIAGHTVMLSTLLLVVMLLHKC